MQRIFVNDNAQAETLISAPDRRAETGARRVAIRRDRIVIARQVLNISMKIAIAASAYRGVALAVVERGQGEAVYVVDLAHADPDLCVRLAESGSDDAAICAWRKWTAFFGLPPLVERAAGVLAPVTEGAATRDAAGAHIRRKRQLMRQRRSRFAMRRKMGRAVAASRALHKEREIIARD